MLKSKLSYTDSLCITTLVAVVASSYISKKTDENNEIAKRHHLRADHYQLCRSVEKMHFEDTYKYYMN